MIRLKPEIAAIIKLKRSLRLKVQGAINASHNTIMKYLDDNDVRLTALDAVNVITEDLQLPLSDIITVNKLSNLMLK